MKKKKINKNEIRSSQTIALKWNKYKIMKEKTENDRSNRWDGFLLNDKFSSKFYNI